MSDALTQKKAAAGHAALLSRVLREGAAIAVGMAALVLAVALLSFHAGDPGFSSTGSGEPVRNLIGVAGAWVADLLLFLFGRPAMLLPLLCGYGAIELARSVGRAEPQPRLHTVLRIIGLLTLLLSSCALAGLHWQPGSLRAGAGGMVGGLIGQPLADALNLLGATLLLLALWAAAAAVAFQLSWLTVMDRLGAWVWGAAAYLRERRLARRELSEGVERRQARKEAAEPENQRVRARPPPRIEAPPPPPERSDRAEKERQVPMFDAPKSSELPPLGLLDDPGERQPSYSPEALEAMSRLLELKLKDFGVEVEVTAVHPGPVITRFEMRPAPGVKASQITALAKDLARALSTTSVRVVEVIPGKSVMGIELPNEKRELVTLGEIIKSQAYEDVASPLALALGKDIGGSPVVADLARMPHLLIAGTTGSGKSVAINAMVLSLLYKSTAEHVRLVMIDPKMLELSVYEGIPHLLAPVVTDPRKAVVALKWAVREMEERYRKMSKLGVRGVEAFNDRVRKAKEKGEVLKRTVQTGFDRETGKPIYEDETLEFEAMPYIVVVVDEVADLMMVSGKEIEGAVQRLAQMARAAGIHLIAATQRPSVDVITGTIKANFPTRISFQVTSKIDSRTILGEQGAEQLLGQGAMLYMAAGGRIQRIHGPFVTDSEVEDVVRFLKTQGRPEYLDAVTEEPDEESDDPYGLMGGNGNSGDEL